MDNDKKQLEQPEIDEHFGENSRKLAGKTLLIVNIICVMMALFQFYTAGFGQLIANIQRAIHLGFGLCITFLIFPITKKSNSNKIPWYDYILAAIGVVVNCYIVINFKELAYRAGELTNLDVVMGILAILILLEAARRIVGPVLTGIASFFILYTIFGNYFPDAVAHRGFSLVSVVRHMYLTTEGIYGVALGVSASFIFLFILMGAVLTKMGTGQILIDLAIYVFGKQRGGPAKAAVFSSALFGMVNGSSVANVVTTGTFTIPLMKRIGFKPFFAGSVEAAASTGGQIMPPIMGAAAFIIAEFLGVSYATVAVAAAVPAFFYFTSILFAVHQESVRLDIKGMPDDQIPKLNSILRRLYLLIPLAAIIVALAFGFSPSMAGFIAIVSSIVLSYISPESRLTPRKLFDAFAEGTKNALEVLVACAVVGFIVGSFTMTGMGLRLASVVVDLGGGNLLLTLILTACASLVLGMGVPTTANYVMMAMITVPALKMMNVVPMAANLFCFYFGIISDLTPPVALAALAGAGLAGAPFWPTAINATKLAITAYIVPFFFAFNPILLIGVAPFSPMFFVVFITTLLGIMLLSCALYNFALIEMKLYERILAFVGAFALIDPAISTSIAGLACLAVVIILQKRRKSKSAVVSESI